MKIPAWIKRPRTIAAAALAAACVLCLAAYGALAAMLPSQHAAERWQGENSMSFGQISCFMPEGEKVSVEQVYAFRNELQKKFHEAALDTSAENKLFNDAWCAFGRAKVSSRYGKGDVHVTAVGGNFFDFHPLRLINGSYISENDLMKDRVLLDEETAWLLFGGTELAGMGFEINGKPFVVAGVISREEDAVSKKAYDSGMGIYMSYEAFVTLGDTEEEAPTAAESAAEISCYELVAAEPVSGFAYSAVSEKFPVGSGITVNNASRYDKGNILRLAKQFGSRAMQTKGVALPYWENAARCIEDRCALLLVLAAVFAVMPLVLAVMSVVRFGRAENEKLTGKLIPNAKEKLEEAIRVRQRARWEKKHPGWDRNSRKQ